ncbi:MAG: type VI secretion system baseplate subunit TssF [Pirellulaceae bacterium]
MSDELLEYYKRERSYMLDMGKAFARANPKIAGRLGLGGDDIKDPHVGRIVEAFAYLNARTRFKLEDDFPEIAASMLDVLYPHFLRPVPSMTVTQFQLEKSQIDLVGGFEIKRHTTLETESIDGEPCRFRTAYPVTAWPFQISDLSLSSHPFQAPQTPYNADATSMLRIQLDTFLETSNFNQMQAKRLRFFIQEQAPYKYDLYELLLTSTIGVALATGPKRTDYVKLPKNCIRPVGFTRDEGMWEYPSRSFLGYRLLAEFFTFPDKFLFFDLELGDALSKIDGPHAEIYIFLDRDSSDLERRLDKENLLLGCTPVINLYRQEAEPIRLTHERTEYHVIPDSRRPLAHEIYSIDDVTAVSRDNLEMPYHPFYSFKHGSGNREARTYWHASRRIPPSGPENNDHGTEMFLTPVDLDFDPSIDEELSLHCGLTCLNRDLPSRLPFGGDQPKMFLHGIAPISKIRCLIPPTVTRRAELGQGIRWRLISHLSLNHLSLADETDGAHALREILGLYDYLQSGVTKSFIDGIVSVKGEPCTARVKTSHGTIICRGTRIHLEFDKTNYSGGGLFLLASILEHFFALYCTINSFTQTVVHIKGEGEFYRWPPRAGEQVLL